MSVDYSKQKCLVCGDKASGLHYTVVSCESCKSFFGRKIKSKAKFTCEANGNCVMDLYTRRHCPACRLKKCLDVGMKPERVWDEKRLETRKPLERKNKKKPIQPPPPPAVSVSTTSAPLPTNISFAPKLSVDQADLIASLDRAKADARSNHASHKPNGKIEELMLKMQELMSQHNLVTESQKDAFMSSLPQALMYMMQNAGGPFPSHHNTKSPFQSPMDLSLPQQDLPHDSCSNFLPEEELQTNGLHLGKEDIKIKEEPLESPMETSCSSHESDSPQSANGVKANLMSQLPPPDSRCQQEMIIYNMTLMGVVIRQTVSFTKAIPAFRRLSYEDQAVLIKNAILEVLMLRCAENYIPERNAFIDDITNSEWTYDSLMMSGFSSATEPTLKFIQALHAMNLSCQEYALLQAITIISPDRPDIEDREAVEQIQKPIVETLQSLTKINHSDDKVFFAKLIMKLTDVRDLVTHHVDDLMQMKLPDSTFESLFPLISEIFSI